MGKKMNAARLGNAASAFASLAPAMALRKGRPRVTPAPLRKVRRPKCQDLDAIILFYCMFENATFVTIFSINSGTE